MSTPFTVQYQYDKKGNNEICIITWTFPRFKDVVATTTTHEFRTPVVADEPASKFTLRMNLLGKNNDLIEIYYISPNSVFLRTEYSLNVESQSQVFGGNGCKQLTSTIADYQTIQGNMWQYLSTIYKRDINCSDYFVILKIIFPELALEELKVSMNEIPTTLELLEDLTNLLSDKKYSDVTLKSVEGDEFQAHKNVLATRSQVLKAHFDHDTIESVTNVIETPFESEVLRDVLAHIYTSKALCIDDIPEKLLAAADYYQLNALKSLCEEAIHQRLTVENAIDTLQLAELHSANSLKQSTLEFIKPQVHLITKSEAWAKLQADQFGLIKAILQYVHCPA